MNLLQLFLSFLFFFLAPANVILISEIAGPSWVLTCCAVSCLVIFWECSSPPPQTVNRENVSSFCKAIWRSWEPRTVCVCLQKKLTALQTFGLKHAVQSCCRGSTYWGFLWAGRVTWSVGLLTRKRAGLGGHCWRQRGFVRAERKIITTGRYSAWC